MGLNEAPWPLPNVWLGVSVEDQKRADERIPVLIDTPAAVRFLSVEPLLGPVNLIQACGTYRGKKPLKKSALDWVIVGGESGKNARPMHPEWVRSIRNQCLNAGVPFFFKQWGEYGPRADMKIDLEHFRYSEMWNQDFVYKLGKKKAGRMLDGRTWDEMPA